MHSFTVSLREQLKGGPVKVIEVLPPAVQTELHDFMGVEHGRQVGAPPAGFVPSLTQTVKP